jgi:hypothetical protein
MTSGLEMRVHDPLWMLARQWQFGEFQGEDTGSPVWAQVRGTASPIALYLPGAIDGHRRDDVQEFSANTPLEYLVEAERLSAVDAMRSNRRLAVEAGQHFLRLLTPPVAAANRAALLKDHRVKPLDEKERARIDPESAAFLDLMADRAVDGASLLAAIQHLSPEDAADKLNLDAADRQEVAAAVGAWFDWCRRMAGEVPASAAVAVAGSRPTWNPERMEYSCALAVPDDATPAGQSVLVAREYTGGHLDWYSFDTANGTALQRTTNVSTVPVSVDTLPTGLNFRGMPSNRLWEFEDAQVRFGSIEAGPTDLARLLMVGFLVEYGNDFFSIPIALDAGALVSIGSLTITNTFGDVTPAVPFADDEWRLFTVSEDAGTGGAGAGRAAPALFLPPVLGQHLASPAIEQIDLARDEMANIAWAIERLVPSLSGRPRIRHEAYQARRQREGGGPPPGEGSPVYRLDTWQSTRPEFWIPLLPEQSAPSQAAARLACYDPQGDIRGQLLSEKRGGAWLYLYGEEIPRSGVQVTRVRQYSRWYDGRTFTWIGREKRTGRGSASSGLRYDAVDFATSATTT